MDGVSNEISTASRAAVGKTLDQLRTQIGDAIMTGAATGTPKPNRFQESEEHLAHRVDQWLTLLIGFFEGKPGYRELAAGQISFEFNQPERSVNENLAAMQEATQAICTEVIQVIAQHGPSMQAATDDGLTELFAGLRATCDTHIETLLIGDCLMGEIAGIATDVTCRGGVAFSSFPVNARTADQLKAVIKDLGDKPYKAVFFSPFSHARSAELETLLSLRNPFRSASQIEAIAERIIAQTAPLVNYLAQTYDCPIYIHTAGLIPRGDTLTKSMLREFVLRRQCGIARKRINTWLKDHIAALNQSLGGRIQLIDETQVAGAMRTGQAGLLVHNSKYQHATHLSFALAKEYANRLQMLGSLYGRKLMICDLDNTLWDGVIGEGAVAHFNDRQKDLARLKNNSGVVLSIASKNDPANVNFKGGTLTEADFVVPQINWGFKSQSIETICTKLNLQKRHTVFVDDRPDELALVKSNHGDITVIDATKQDVWDQVSLWADLVEQSSDVDRTSMYQAKDQRDAFVDTLKDATVSNADADFLKEMQFVVDVRPAKGSDIRRATELINRTNQWNLCGSRTSVADLDAILATDGAMVLIASAKDKFGKMGDICVAVVVDCDTNPTISMFVLSCRVFGYSVETKMIDYIKDRITNETQSATLMGLFMATNQNSLAKNMYAKNGFTSEDGHTFMLDLTK